MTLHLGDPCEGLGKNQGFGGNQPPLSFILSSQYFRTFQCHFYLKHLSRVVVEPLMERKSLQAACLQVALQFAQSNLSKDQGNMKR